MGKTENDSPSHPNCPALLSATGRGRVAGAGVSALILPAVPNTPGNVAGSLPPGRAGSHRLPGLTRADLCRRAEHSPAGQKLGV